MTQAATVDQEPSVEVPADRARPGEAPALPVPSGELEATTLTSLSEARALGGPAGARSAQLRSAAPDLAAEIVASGRPSGITTGDLALRPHPTEQALDRAPRSPAPTVWLTHRLIVVQWPDGDGHTRTLLWGPTHEDAYEAAGGRRAGARRLGTVLGHLRALGIDPAHVDLLAFPDLQGQDVRRWLGTTRPAPDLGAHDDVVPAAFPRAQLLTARAEWDTLARPHPLQRPAYRPEAFADLPPDRVIATEQDLLLGPGVAFIGTPGRTPGTSSLVLHAQGGPQGGMWVASANGVAAECWAPRASRIPGVRHHAVEQAREVIGHRTAADDATAHHDAMLVERILADPCEDAPFPRCFPAAELTAHRRSPGIRPTYVHRRLAHGLVRGQVHVRELEAG